MPNRILKDSICTSETVDGLSADEEVFFYRLIVNCDDHGLMDARPRVLRSRLYPLRVDRLSDTDMEEWLTALVRAGIVRVYRSGGRPYLQMLSWARHQQIRAIKPKFPLPDAVEDSSDRLDLSDVQPSDISCKQLQPHAPVIQSNRNPIQSNPIHAASDAISETPDANGSSDTAHPRVKVPPPKAAARHMWDAFAIAGLVAPRTDRERGKWNRGIGDLLKAGKSIDDVPVWIRRYRARFGNQIPCNPQSIANNLSHLEDDVPVEDLSYQNGRSNGRPPPSNPYLTAEQLAEKARLDQEQLAEFVAQDQAKWKH